MAVVILPRSLVALFPGSERHVEVGDVGTVAGAIDALEARWPGMRDRLVEAGPGIREYINVFVDGEPAALETAVPAAATVHVLPAVAGG
jgi:sulfur-carrier protein